MTERNKHLFGRSDIEQKNHDKQTTRSEEIVLSLLKASPEIDISGIKVFVHDQEIHLAGEVENVKEKTDIESLIKNYFDEELISHLTVKSDEDELGPGYQSQTPL